MVLLRSDRGSRRGSRVVRLRINGSVEKRSCKHGVLRALAQSFAGSIARRRQTKNRGTVHKWRYDSYAVSDRCAFVWYVQAIFVYDDGTGVDRPVRNQTVSPSPPRSPYMVLRA